MIIACYCDEHYGGDALACAKAIASGTKTPCACDCHRAEESEIVPVAELARLRLVEEAARHYRFAGTPASHEFLRRRGWEKRKDASWNPPADCPARERDNPCSCFVALAIELELALGCHG